MGASETCTATYTTTQTDVDNGSINNTGTASGTGGGQTVTAMSSATVNAAQTPSIGLKKTAVAPGAGNTYSAPGQTIHYSYKVTNTGNVDLTSVGVTDPMSGLSAISCGSTTLAVGASETCTATYSTTQTDVDNGSINNTGTASGTGGGMTVTAMSSATVDAAQSPSIGLKKTAVAPGPGNTYSAPGQTIDYSYKVSNTGNVDLSSVGVTDPMSGLSAISCGSTTLAVGASETCTATYTTTQADVNAGSINNTGTASGTGGGQTVTAMSSATVNAAQTPSIGLKKTAVAPGAGNTYSAPGQTIHYSYKVTNTGNVDLTSVGVTDPMSGLSAISCGSTTLAVGASETCTATYSTTQTDVDNGSINNTGTASGTGGGMTVTAMSSATVDAAQSPSIGLKKTAVAPGPGNTYDAPGQTIDYSYKVSNTGNVDLSSVGVTDPMSGLSAISCGSTTLAVGASETCTATYTTTQGDVNAGSVHNTGTASGTGGGQTVTAVSSATVHAVQTPSIGLKKTAVAPGAGNTYSAPGQTIDYSYKVSNTGNVDLSSVGVTDPMSGLSAISCPSTTLAVGASETCTATYTTTQGDVNAGSVHNTGTASGTGGGQTVTAVSSATVHAVQTPAIGLKKTAVAPGPGNTYSAPGQTIHYSYKVTNTGNVDLSSVGVTDPMSGLSAISCGSTTLAVGASETCTATYTTTQGDVNAGSINNTGTASGTGGGQTVTAMSSATVDAAQSPAIGLKKTAVAPGAGNTYSAPGQTIHYSYKVTNTGNVDLSSVGVTDPMSGLSAISCASTTLAVAASDTCTATYTTTQADVNAGSINNTGTASGTGGGQTVTAMSSATVDAAQSPAIGLKKTAVAPGPGNTYSAPGQTIHYSYKVTNTGNVDLSSVGVTDPMSGLSAISCKSTTLAVGASETCTATYTTTQADVNAGSINNTGTASGTGGGQTVTAMSSATVDASQSPAIGLKKTAVAPGPGNTYSAPGQTIHYSYKVTNTGNVDLSSVGVTDPMSGLSAISCKSTTLAVGASETCTATYTTTQADVNAGSINNTGTASGTGGGQTVTAMSSATVDASQSPTIGLKKTAVAPGPGNTYSAPGQTIHYSYKVTNTGNVDLSSVGVTDPMSGLSAISCGSTTLAVGASETCTATYTTTQADVDNGSINNTGTASGTGGGQTVTAMSSATVDASQSPTIGLKKTAVAPGAGNTYSAPGQTIHYSYKVTNTGNVDLSAVGVTDPMSGLSAISCGSTTLAVGASETCTATYTTTQADVDNGSINNTGTASGTGGGQTVTAMSSATVDASQSPAIGLKKTAVAPGAGNTYSAPGQTIHYSYKVTNTGNVDLTAVGVTDPMSGLSAISCGSTTLAVGASETCTATYTTTQADVDNGSISNTGTASGTGGGQTVTAMSSATVDAAQSPAIGLKKTAVAPGPGNTYDAPGQTIHYSYKVTNTGNVDLTSVGVTDPMSGLSAISCGSTTLAVGASETCTATYTTTQADVNAGSVHNTGTASGTGGGQTVTAMSSATVNAVQSPAIGLKKTAVAPGPGNTYDAPGQTIHYSYKVTNTGNVDLTSVGVTDPMSGLSAISCGSTTLAVGASETCTATYTTTQADVNAGSVHNTGTASGTGGGQTVTAMSSATVNAVQSPAIGLKKTAVAPGAGNTYSAPGQTIDYSYKVTNTGNVDLSSVGVTDPMSGLSAISCGSTTLAVGASETCTATYTTTQADVDNGSINNTGTASGTGGGQTVTAKSSATVDAAQSPTIGLVKTATAPGPDNTYNAVGQTIDYAYKVTNTGNVDLTAVGVTDPMSGLSAISCASTTLAPLASETCTATYTTTQGDVNNGSINNTGTASGTGAGQTVTAMSSATVDAVQSAGISLTKTASVPYASSVGQAITYTFAFANTGNVDLTDVNLTDAQKAPSLDSSLGSITCTTGTPGTISLPVGASDSCSAVYTTTQADITNGTITDTGTVTGTAPIAATSGTAHAAAATSTVTQSATLTLDVLQISQVKAASPPTVVAGSNTPIVYTITVNNTGTVTTATPIVDTDAAPAGTTLVSGSPACTGGPPACTVALSGSTITWTIPAGVTPTTSYTLTFSVTANASDPTGTIGNTADWTGPGCTTTPSCTTNPVTTSVTAAPVTAAATVTPAPPAAPAPAAAAAPVTTPAIAFTGALLSDEWIIGASAILLGAGLVLITRRRRPKHAGK